MYSICIADDEKYVLKSITEWIKQQRYGAGGGGDGRQWPGGPGAL